MMPLVTGCLGVAEKLGDDTANDADADTDADADADADGIPAEGEDCGSLTFEGCCASSDLLVYCLDDSVNHISCDAGQYCVWMDASVGYVCAPPSTGYPESDPSGTIPRECPVD